MSQSYITYEIDYSEHFFQYYLTLSIICIRYHSRFDHILEPLITSDQKDLQRILWGTTSERVQAFRLKLYI